VKMRTRLREVDVTESRKIYRRLNYNALKFLRSAGNAFANIFFVGDESPVFPRTRNCHKVKVEIPFFATLVINPRQSGLATCNNEQLIKTNGLVMTDE